jgi:flagellar motor switch protein FliG
VEPSSFARPADLLDGLQKSAALLISLGAEVSAEILKSLSESEVEALSKAIGRLPQVSPALTKRVLEEFAGMVDSMETAVQGGLPYATAVLEQALGAKKAKAVLEKVQTDAPTSGLCDGLKRLDPKTVADFLAHEHPQTVALVLARMEAPQAAQLLAGFAADFQSEVVLRIAQMDRTSPEVLEEIEAILERRFSALSPQQVAITGGPKAVAEIMNRLDRTAEKHVLARIQEADGTLAETIRGQMFTFEDIVQVDDRGIQRLLKEVEQHDLVLSLKAATPDLTAKIFRNMSERARGLIKEEISFLGPTRLRDVEEAQRRIVEVVRRLEEEGDLLVAGRGGQDEVLV